MGWLNLPAITVRWHDYLSATTFLPPTDRRGASQPMQGKSCDERLASHGRIWGKPSNPSGELIGHQDRKGKLNPSKPQNALGWVSQNHQTCLQESQSKKIGTVCLHTTQPMELGRVAIGQREQTRAYSHKLPPTTSERRVRVLIIDLSISNIPYTHITQYTLSLLYRSIVQPLYTKFSIFIWLWLIAIRPFSPFSPAEADGPGLCVSHTLFVAHDHLQPHRLALNHPREIGKNQAAATKLIREDLQIRSSRQK